MTFSNANYFHTTLPNVALEIEGYEGAWLLMPSFPLPQLPTVRAIQYPTPLGANGWQCNVESLPTECKVSLIETTKGPLSDKLLRRISNEFCGSFRATVYVGTPQKFARAYRLTGCSFRASAEGRDPPGMRCLAGTFYSRFTGEMKHP